tara:strand:- start:24366 stop:25565 length:1200 start_codon:yes stop_codon:yes gene_type:complete
MSLQQAAQHLAAQGRGKDTTLVHMTPNEVQGLQQIAMAAGGSLSINPSTGLPEAGFLENMLPMIIGAGLIAATGGAAAPAVMSMPAAIGLGVGGVQALRTGNLMEGVKAGLGAYGGAGLAGGLMGAGASSVDATASALGTPAATGAGSQAQMLAAQNAGFGQAGLESLGQSAAGAAGAAPVVNTAGQSMLAGAKGLGTEAGREGFMSSIGGLKGLAKSGLAGLAPMMMQEPEAPPAAASDKDMGQRYAYDPGTTTPFPEPNVPRAGSPEQFQSFGKEQRFFTPGYRKIGADEAKSIYGFAQGGVSHLGDYSDGGRLLRGPGDGVSDSIPAVIGKKQPARLADGEFVVPARIVSELGNGSTEAGARKLYAMMDRIQSARGKTVGKGKVAKNSRAERLLPA